MVFIFLNVTQPQISSLLCGIRCCLAADLRMQNHSWRVSEKLTEEVAKHKTNLQIHGVALYEILRAQYNNTRLSLDRASGQAQKSKQLHVLCQPSWAFLQDGTRGKKHMYFRVPVLKFNGPLSLWRRCSSRGKKVIRGPRGRAQEPVEGQTDRRRGQRQGGNMWGQRLNCH